MKTLNKILSSLTFLSAFSLTSIQYADAGEYVQYRCGRCNRIHYQYIETPASQPTPSPVPKPLTPTPSSPKPNKLSATETLETLWFLTKIGATMADMYPKTVSELQKEIIIKPAVDSMVPPYRKNKRR